MQRAQQKKPKLATAKSKAAIQKPKRAIQRKKKVTSRPARSITTKKRLQIGMSSILPTAPTAFTSTMIPTTVLNFVKPLPLTTTAKRGAKCNAEELRAGSLIKWGPEDKLFKVTSVEKKMMGRRPTSLSLDLKCLTTNKVFPTRMMPADTVDRIDLDMKWLGFLYAEGEIGVLMNNDTFEQMEFPSEMLGKFAKWIPVDEKLVCQFYEGSLFSIQHPDSVIWEVEGDDTDLNTRNSTIKDYKNVFLTNGERLAVPEFVKAGDKVKVKLEDFSFMVRAND